MQIGIYLKHWSIPEKEYCSCLCVYMCKWCVVWEVVGQHVQRPLLLDAHQDIKPKELAVALYCCCWASQLSSDCLHASLFRLQNVFLAGCLKVHLYFQVACIFGDRRSSKVQAESWTFKTEWLPLSLKLFAFVWTAELILMVMHGELPRYLFPAGVCLDLKTEWSFVWKMIRQLSSELDK